MLIDDDPTTAYQHTLAARARAARLAVVREACGEAAYAAGEYAEALSELRAAKRINGSTAYLPVMADCERALGRPERALTLAKSPAVANFDPTTKAEMTIVEAGARRDLGEYDAALRTLENAPLNNKTRATWVVRLRYTYADTLLAAGRPADALEWFHRTEAIDADETTDAATRATTIEKTLDSGPATPSPPTEASRLLRAPTTRFPSTDGPGRSVVHRGAVAPGPVVGTGGEARRGGDVRDQRGLSAGPAVPSAGGEGAAQR